MRLSNYRFAQSHGYYIDTPARLCVFEHCLEVVGSKTINHGASELETPAVINCDTSQRTKKFGDLLGCM